LEGGKGREIGGVEGGVQGDEDFSKGMVVAIDGVGAQVLAEAACKLISKGGGEEGHVVEESGVGRRCMLLLLLVVRILRPLVLLPRGTLRWREGRGGHETTCRRWRRKFIRLCESCT
jgi:hypothetical protein